MKRWNHRVARGHFTQRDYGKVNMNEEVRELVDHIRGTAEEEAGLGEDLDLEHIVGLLRHEADRLEAEYIRSAEEHEEKLRELGVINPPTETVEEEVYICPADNCYTEKELMQKMHIHLRQDHGWKSKRIAKITTDDLETTTVEKQVELQ